MDHQIYCIFEKEEFKNLTDGLKIAQCMKSADDDSPEDNNFSDVNKRLDELCVSDKLFCSFCNVAFEDKIQQRLHYKLDWHRYNLRQNLLGRPLVNEEEFQRLADDVSSISGSESESESSDEEDNCKKDFENNEKTNVSSHKLQVERHSKIFFENANGKILSVYRCILHDKKITAEKDVDSVTSLLKCPDNTNWAIIMLGGGHFAAAIFNEKEAIVHKTFHSYTVRARQGGTQSSRDGRSGGSHPKSAGASLRRYNEAAFNQHIQDILSEWIKHIEACSIILCRAVGHNRNLLFGGRNPPLNKNDSRVRTIPFPTRRATFKEVQRVHGILSSVEVYGSAETFQTSFPISPRKKQSKTSLDKKIENNQTSEVPENITILTEGEEATEDTEGKEPRNSRSPRQKKTIDRAKSRPSPRRPLPGTEVLEISSSENSDLEEASLTWVGGDQEVDMQQNLQEFEDTVPLNVKKEMAKKRNKPVKKKKKKPVEEKEKCNEAVQILREKLLAACTLSNIIVLKECLTMCNSENHNSSNEGVTSDDLHKCLNEHVRDNGSTLLHIAAENGNNEMLRCLLEAGCDPSLKNKKAQPPFAVSADRDTRSTFRKFMGEFPNKYDYRKAQIPGPLTEELEKELAEKRKEQKKVKKERERERKREETEKDRFLKLSDREKRALAAEKRILASNAQGRSNIKVISRCFECADDITGKVPFEYDIHRFCTMDCLKRHRLKMKSQSK